MTARRSSPVPPFAVAVAAVPIALVSIPLVALLVRAPWSDLGSRLTDDVALDALRLSLVTSLAATVLSLAFGIPLAWTLARADLPGRSLLRALITVPMVLPPVVGGAALLFAFGRRGVVGDAFTDATGVVLPFSTWGVIVANTFVALPFLVVSVEGAIRGLDERYEAAAATLGAGRWFTFRYVTLPLIGPSVVAGAVLCWARALGEFGATITFAGNLQDRTQTMPLAVFVALETDRDAAVAMSLVMVAVALAVLVALRNRWYVTR